jgi:hypothetical protein
MEGIRWLAESAWAYPALEVVHIVGIALLVGNLVAFELRVWGAAPALDLRALARLSLRLAVAGFALAAASGTLLFAANPADTITNPLFVAKLVLVTTAGINAAIFHARDGLARADRAARVQTALSIGIWLGVIICGRFMAYR